MQTTPQCQAKGPNESHDSAGGQNSSAENSSHWSSEDEFVRWDEGGHDGGYANIRSKKRSDNDWFRTVSDAWDDAWESVGPACWQCWEAAAPLNQAGAAAMHEELCQKRAMALHRETIERRRRR